MAKLVTSGTVCAVNDAHQYACLCNDSIYITHAHAYTHTHAWTHVGGI